MTVPLALALLMQAPVAAQEEPLPEGVALEFLAFAVSAPLPEDADDLLLFRMTLAPGASFDIEPDEGSVTLAEVESGTLTSTVDGEVAVSRAEAEEGVTETIPADETVTLAAGDSALYPPDLTGAVSNEGSEEVTLLILEAISTASVEAPSMATPVAGGGGDPMAPEGVSVELLSAGAAPEVEGEVVFALARVTYDPGISQDGELQPGSEVSIVEAGTFTLEVTAGPPVRIYRDLGASITSGQEPAIETIDAGETVEVAAGDSAYFPMNNVAAASNMGDEPATALLGFVFPAAAAGM
jgi:quercetin dioxygenase-like cupin family protein